jgi:hypothetical protein
MWLPVPPRTFLSLSSLPPSKKIWLFFFFFVRVQIKTMRFRKTNKSKRRKSSRRTTKKFSRRYGSQARPNLFTSEAKAYDYAREMGGDYHVTEVNLGPGADWEVTWDASAFFATKEEAEEFARPWGGKVSCVWEVKWDAPEPPEPQSAK